MIVAREKLHSPDWQIGLISAAPAIGSVFALFWANAMDGKSKMPWAAGSWIIGRVLFLGMLVCYTPLQFTLCVVASQIIVTVSGPAYASIMKDVYPDDNRGRIMSYCRVLLAITMIASTVVVGPLLQHVSYRYIFPIGGLAGVISALVFARIKLPEIPSKKDYKKPPTLQFLKNSFAILVEDRQFAWFAMSVFTYGFGNLLLSPVYPVFAVDRLHISTSQQSILMGIFYVIWTFSYLFWGKYVDVKSPLKCAAISVFINGLVPINYFFATSPWHLVPSYILNGIIGAGIELAYFNAVLRFSDETRVSHYQAIFSCLFGIRGTIAPLIGTAVKGAYDAGGVDYKYMFLMGLVIIWVGGVMQVIGFKTRYNKRS